MRTGLGQYKFNPKDNNAFGEELKPYTTLPEPYLEQLKEEVTEQALWKEQVEARLRRIMLILKQDKRLPLRYKIIEQAYFYTYGVSQDLNQYLNSDYTSEENKGIFY